MNACLHAGQLPRFEPAIKSFWFALGVGSNRGMRMSVCVRAAKVLTFLVDGIRSRVTRV
jgi:hypothetical protein